MAKMLIFSFWQLFKKITTNPTKKPHNDNICLDLVILLCFSKKLWPTLIHNFIYLLVLGPLGRVSKISVYLMLMSLGIKMDQMMSS